MGHHVLGFTGVLGRTMHHHVLILSGKGKGNVALQVKVFLPSNFHTTTYGMRCTLQPGLRVAALQRQRRCNMRLPRLQRRSDTQHRFHRFDLDPCQRRGPSCRIAAFGHNGKQGLAVKFHQLVRENRLVPGPHRADLVMPRYIRRRQHPHDTRGSFNRAQVQHPQPPMRHLRHTEIRVQRAQGFGNVVTIFRPPRDMLFGTVMRHRVMNTTFDHALTPLSSRAVCPPPCSAQNRRNRFWATSIR